MSVTQTQLPMRRLDLVVRPLGEDGRYVVKDPRSGQFYQLGEQEHFLLMQLDGQREASEVCAEFEQQFGKELAEGDLDGFVQMASAQRLLETADGEHGADVATNSLSSQLSNPQSRASSGCCDPKPKQSFLHWRVRLFDPDRLFNWLEPKLRFFWTPGFVVFAAVSVGLATGVALLNRYELASSLKDAFRWETAIWFWLTMFAIITLHEFAHGLTCKHFGGEVREIGFLLLFCIPCFYCNVSDAWLFRERSKRLWVTFAGGFFQLFLWSIAVFVWRVTLPGTFPNYLAFIVVTYCGVNTLMNFNPLTKLDGYYLLSDWLEVPNLQERGINRFKAHLRRWLWGAPSPSPERCGGTLFAYGLVSWAYGLALLAAVLWGMYWFVGERWGVVGMSAVTVVGLVSTRGIMKQTSSGEARRMVLERHKRLAAWLAVLVGVTAALCLVQVEEGVQGTFLVRPRVRAELRARASGFVQLVHVDEGDRVSAKSVVAKLEIPDLASRITQKQAEIREAEANLRLLEIGERPEQIAQQRMRVKRTIQWRDLGQQDLNRMQRALADELTSLEKRIAACQAEAEVAQQNYQRKNAC